MENLKILVVDDEDRMRKLVKDFLTIRGFQVIEAGEGRPCTGGYQKRSLSCVIRSRDTKGMGNFPFLFLFQRP